MSSTRTINAPYLSVFTLLAFVTLLLVSVVLRDVSPAVAADLGCGRDTDRNGSTDSFCPGEDQDNDGFTASQGDCNDTDFDIFPGATWGGAKVGCSTAQYRTCKADRSGFTACTDTASHPFCPQGEFSTHTGKSASRCYYFDPAHGSDTSGDGSFAKPWRTPNKISHNNTNRHLTQPGDAYMFRGGLYTEQATADTANQVALFFATPGTASNPIWFVGYPGEKATFKGRVAMLGADYSIGRNIEITQGTNPGAGLDFTDDTDASDWALLYIHEKTGSHNENQACIKYFQGGSDNIVHHNYLANCYDPNHSELTGSGVLMGQQDSNARIEFNNMINDPNKVELCVYEKHIYYGSSGTVKSNYCQNAYSFYQTSGGFHRVVSGNLAVSCERGARIANSAGPTFFGGLIMERNTFLCNYAVNSAPGKSHHQDNSTDGVINEECGGNVPNWDSSEYRFNLAISDIGNFEAHVHGEYQSDATYALWHENRAWSAHHNGYYSTTGSALKYRVFGWNDGCTDYCCANGNSGFEATGLPEIQAKGYEANSLFENPSLDSRFLPTNPAMSEWGYRSGGGGGGISPPSGLTVTIIQP